MQREELLSRILDSWNKPVVFADTDHIIRYMNKEARKHYAKWGDVIGKSLLDCHNGNSVRIIKDCFARHQAGEDEVLYIDNEKHRVYSRAVRDEAGNLIGYTERYEPARGK
jgi:DUF438 domain-containing protein